MSILWNLPTSRDAARPQISSPGSRDRSERSSRSACSRYRQPTFGASRQRISPPMASSKRPWPDRSWWRLRPESDPGCSRWSRPSENRSCQNRDMNLWRREYFWPAVLIVLGVYFLLSNLNLLTWLRGDLVWPLLLIALGLWLILRRARTQTRRVRAKRDRNRSLFWPAVLILVGVFALLVNSGLVAPERLDRLVDLWPLILVVIGLELLVRRSLQGANAELAAVLIVALAIVGATAYVALGPAIPTGTHTLDVSGKVGSLKQASVRVEAKAAQITMEGADIGADLYRAHVVYSGNPPHVVFAESDGDLQILQSNSSGFFFQDRRFALDLKLNTRVMWKIVVDSGASSDSFNLSSVPVSDIQLNPGASREDITLGSPSGSVQITVNGGALTAN